MSAKPGCSACGNALAKELCSGCKVAVYCGKDCQREHWKTHKPQCAALKKSRPEKVAEMQNAVGLQYFDSAATVQNAELTMAFFRQAAENGDVNAACNLGTMLVEKLMRQYQHHCSATAGRHFTTIDATNTVENFNSVTVASRGKTRAMGTVAAASAGMLEGSALAVARDEAVECVKWFTFSADGNWGKGCFNLAVVYQNGILVPRDMKKAKFLFARCLTCGDPEVRKAAKFSLETASSFENAGFVTFPLLHP